MRRLALLLAAVAALLLAAAADGIPAAKQITAKQNGSTLLITAKLAHPASVAASCEIGTFDQHGNFLRGINLGTSASPAGATVTVQVLLGPASGRYLCWLRSDPADFGTPATAVKLKNGKPAEVRGTIS